MSSLYFYLTVVEDKGDHWLQLNVTEKKDQTLTSISYFSPGLSFFESFNAAIPKELQKKTAQELVTLLQNDSFIEIDEVDDDKFHSNHYANLQEYEGNQNLRFERVVLAIFRKCANKQANTDNAK